MAEDSNLVIITVLNPVYAQIDKPELIDGYLRYYYEWWQQGQYRKVRHEARIRLVNKTGCFLAGFLPRVRSYLEKRGYAVAIKVDNVPVPAIALSELSGIAYRDDQKRALQEILMAERGVYQAPTGSGKTVLIAGLVASIRAKMLVIVHTTTLFNQTVVELSRWNMAVGKVCATEEKLENVTVAMRQTLARRIKSGSMDGDFMGRWGAVIVDEAHHISSLKGDYATILMKINAPVRIGFTATLPVAEEASMALEGLLGPIIGKTSYEELEQTDVLAKPKIKFYRVPDNPKYKMIRGSYAQIYDKVVVKNRRRNLLIVEKALEQLEQGKSVLILVERIEHGELLMELLEIRAPGSFVFLQGKTPEDVKTLEKKAFDSKGRMGVVATRIWSEGVNIPSVDVVINAVGGESEIAAIQRFGRGLRRTGTKSEVLLIDFLDRNHRWMADHSMSRMCTYSESGWL